MPTKTKRDTLNLNGIKLTRAQLQLVVEALDSHIYWQLSDEEYRDNGFVNAPGSDDEEASKEITEATELHDLFEDLVSQVEG